MENYLENEFVKYINKLQSELNLQEDAIRLIVCSTNENIERMEDYLNESIEKSSKVFLDIFEDDDDVIINIEARDADLEESYDEIIEDEVIHFYNQFIKNNKAQTYTKTFSIFVKEDGSEGFTDYEHVDLLDEDGNKLYVETLTSHILEGKVKDFEMIGLLVGKCNLLEGFDGENSNEFIIGDSITIINKTKNTIYKLHNDVYLDVFSTNKELLNKLKEEYADIITL